MTSGEYLGDAPENFIWPRCPEAEGFIQGCLDEFLRGHRFSAHLAQRMMEETSTRFFDWVDHIVVPAGQIGSDELFDKYGFILENGVAIPRDDISLWHPHAQLPRVILSSRGSELSCAIRVESIRDFQTAHSRSEVVEGAPLSSYRVARLPDGPRDLLVVERRGPRGYLPDGRSMADPYLRATEAWANRPRRFKDDGKGMQHAERLARHLVADLGADLAASAFLEAERLYWQARNSAGRLQKWRQDKLGLGWANHDHHTFRSSRQHFSEMIEIFRTFGFQKRERFYAGAEAGWGAQIIEQPTAGLVIFADVDLSPDEVEVDFSSERLDPRSTLGTVGLWCALHGESILQAGMHHLEAQFDFEHLRQSLQAYGVDTMDPFSDFSYLRQAFTRGEQWEIDPGRLETLSESGAISREAYEKFETDGAIGSHLENLQRREGFKGFNSKSVSRIIQEVNPERQVLQKN